MRGVIFGSLIMAPLLGLNLYLFGPLWTAVIWLLSPVALLAVVWGRG